MLRLHNINDTECPELAPYRSMRKMSDQLGQGLFVAEGLKVVTRLLETDLNIHSLLLTQHWFDSLREKLEKRQESMDVFITDKKGIEKLTGFGAFRLSKPLQMSRLLLISARFFNLPFLLVFLLPLTGLAVLKMWEHWFVAPSDLVLKRSLSGKIPAVPTFGERCMPVWERSLKYLCFIPVI